MSELVFRFKQFSVRHRDSAMKVGVDGVLLGAWAEIETPFNILDIGTGTGLIALMMAQRFPNAKITGIEIEKAAYEEARYNFEQSDFSERCNAVHSSVQVFKPIQKYDLIICNPPYFEANHLHDSARGTARQQTELNFNTLLTKTKRLLTPLGRAGFIIPYPAEQNFLEIAKKHLLYPEKITRVKGNPKTTFKRSLLLFSNQKATNLIEDELIIELSRNNYSEAYINLTKPFYLKM